jgi:hypothetical protein
MSVLLRHDANPEKRPQAGCWGWRDLERPAMGDAVAQCWATLPCGHSNNISGHGIKADGTVQPSVECYHRDFHDEVKLEAWDGGERMILAQWRLA